MSNQIKVKSSEFNEAISVLKQISISLDSSINKINLVSNKLSSTWDSKSGKNFTSKNKSMISNMKSLSNSIEDLANELNNINYAYTEMDSLISSKIRG